MNRTDQVQTILLGLLGAVAGGCVGYFAFAWIYSQGFYALILPPALLGWGAGLCSRRRSVALAVTCAVLGLALGLFIEWRFFPFVADPSFPYLLMHVYELKLLTLGMLALGTFFSYRFALGYDPGSKSSQSST